MKILFVYEAFPAFFQPYLEEQAFEVSQIKSIALSILSVSDKNRHLGRYPFERISYKSKDLYLLNITKAIFARIINLIKKEKQPLDFFEQKILNKRYDIVHLQESFLFGRIQRLSKAESKPKIVVTLRGGDTYIKPWVNPKWHNYISVMKDNIDAFQVMSAHQAKYLTEKWNVPAAKIFIIPPAVNIEKFKQDIEKPWGDILLIASTFRFCWEKSIYLNLKVIEELVRRKVKVKYIVFGDGPNKGELFYWLDRLGLNDYVEFKGKVRPEQLTKEYKKIHLLLQLSASEALPTAVLEAQSLGIPSIVSDSGGLPESIISGKTGYVIPYGEFKLAADKILDLWNDEAAYKEFSIESKIWSRENFSHEVEVQKLMNMYNKILQKEA